MVEGKHGLEKTYGDREIINNNPERPEESLKSSTGLRNVKEQKNSREIQG